MGAVSLLAVVGVAWWESAELTSPGPLHPSHAHVRDLKGRRGCRTCHGDPQAAKGDACVACHDAIREQIAARRGVHGALAPEVAALCSPCHVEHAGDSVALVSDASFRAVGVESMTAFDHAPVPAFALVDRHADLTCVQCHPHADAPRLLPGQRRYLDRSQDCVACHTDTHKGSYGEDCASCHGQAYPFERVAAFIHNAAFPLSGGHDALACKRCHEANTAYAVAVLQGRTTWSARRCAECHRAPHRDSFVQRIRGAPAKDGDDVCAACHAVEHKTFRYPQARMPEPLHAATGFALELPHQQLECRACHAALDPQRPTPDEGDPQARFAAVFPGRTPQACEACHDDPHRGQFTASRTRGRCIACHAETHFFPAQFDVAMHVRTVFPLTGAHEAIACRSCHKEMEGARRFARTPTSCGACHEDVHAGLFDAADKPATVGGKTGCARCHGTTDFHDIEWPPAVHGQWTGYALRGAHGTVACTACHAPVRDAGGRTVSLAKASTVCSTCHQDPHAGQFRRGDGTDCARCHTETAPFTKAVFDHQADSRFPLDGKHINLACAACHKPGAVRAGKPVIRYRPLGTRCADCHGFAVGTLEVQT